MEQLQRISAKELDKFIEVHLLPDSPFREQVKSAIDTICSFLKERCFQGHSHPVCVSKVVKGGSSGKGTTLRGRSDADIVVFLSPLTGFREQFERRAEFIKEIRRQLEACQREKGFAVQFEIPKHDWSNPRVLSFKLLSHKFQKWVEFDVLPAYDVLGQVTGNYRPDPKIYVSLLQECQRLGTAGEFSSCFTELQRAFLKQRPAKLKSLIRLVKHWYQMCERKLKQKGSLPPKYALELLTIYAWEQGSGALNFDTTKGFRTVLELATRHQQLCIFWTVNYNFEDEIVRNFLLTQIQRPRPVILDPADPTGDVGGGNRWCWYLLAEEATEWLSTSLCFKDGAGYPIQSWEVPTVQTPGSCGADMYPVVNEMFSFRSRGFLC
ncbi:2'-5'-oligoadenylate synthase 1-like [Saccopteryx bilineata]|uniref:2'-5'-oligoadenylate synthase 1-like n=1 Tax=Saccopteryx bilineata TaxID=59482 RepID=UPI00338F0D1C